MNVRVFSFFSKITAASIGRFSVAVVFVVACLDLSGGLLKIPVLESDDYSLTSMKITTAGCFLVSAWALLCLLFDRFVRLRKRIIIFSGAAITAIGLLVTTVFLFELFTGRQWPWTNDPIYRLFLAPSSRMAFVTAIMFFLYGCVLILLGTGSRRAAGAGHIVLLPVSMLAYLVIIGFLLHIPSLHTWLNLSVAANTSLGFCGLCVASFCAAPDTWFMNVFTVESVGAAMARRLLPFLLLLPLLVGWLRIEGERSKFFESEVGVAIVAVAYTFSYLWLVWLNARSINRTDLRRRKAEDTVHKSEGMLKRAQEIAHLGSWELDLANNRLFWSDEVYRIFGLQPQEFDATYGTFLEAVHPDDRAAVDAAYSGSIRDGKIFYETEHRVVKKHSEEVIFVHEKCEHFRDDSGKIVRSIGMVHDVTERKRLDEVYKAHARLLQFSNFHSLDELLEETLNETENLTGSLIGFLHFVDSDQNHLTLQAWSTRTKQVFCKAEGKGSHYAISKAGVWVDCIYQRKPVIHNDYYSLPYKKGLPEGHAQVIRELVVPVIEGDKIVAILGVGNKKTDYNDLDSKVVLLMADLVWTITERKKAEDDLVQAKNQLEIRVMEKTVDLKNAMGILEAERQRFNNVLEMLPACVVLLTPDHHVKFANRFFTERFGKSNGKRCFEFLFFRNQPCENCETLKPFTTHTPHHWEWTGPDKRIYDIYAYPFMDVDGSPLIMEMGLDITDHKKAEAALREANEMKLLGQLTSGVAHEVRNPLNGIMAIMGALSKELSDNDRFHPYMQHMRSQVTRLTTLMEDLLLIGRPLREENMQAISMATLVENALAAWLQTMQTFKPCVRIIKPEDPNQCMIRADPTNMTQVIINLLENAYNHSPKGSEIVCSIHCQVANTVFFCIKDAGHGIAENILPRIFDPFFTTRKGGTGLGLSIVRHIVEIHQGSVFAYNNIDGPGTTFEIVLPLSTKN